jgi:hypothetical protein
MIMDSKNIVGLVSQLIDVRNTCRRAIAGNEQVIEVPAVPPSDANPGKPASKKATGQLPNANNNLFVAATNLIGHLRNIGGTDVDVQALEKALNAPLAAQPSVKAPVNTAAQTATAAAPGAK